MVDQILLRAAVDHGTTLVDRNQLQRFDWLLQALDIFTEEALKPYVLQALLKHGTLPEAVFIGIQQSE